MDGHRFDAWTRLLSARLSRRRGAGLVLGAVVAGASGVGGANAAVRRRTCRPAAASCLRNSDCCTGACDTRRTTPRNQRNRCICVPDCAGKVCGGDGCGGSCGACESWEVCAADGESCGLPCDDFVVDQVTFCEGDYDGGRYIGYHGWQMGERACTRNDECQVWGICDDPGYECICEKSWVSRGGDAEVAHGDGACYALRTVAHPCSGIGYDGKPNCVESVDGLVVGFDTWDDEWITTHIGDSCETDEFCVNLDADCTRPGNACVCAIGWGNVSSSWYPPAAFGVTTPRCVFISSVGT